MRNGIWDAQAVGNIKGWLRNGDVSAGTGSKASQGQTNGMSSFRCEEGIFDGRGFFACCMDNVSGSWSLHGAGRANQKGLPSVIVVGAGMAGLVIARLLNDTGFSVVVLEARARLGGRIWTDSSMGVPCDLGASWIHGAKRNNLTSWCRFLGIECVISPRGGILFCDGGRCRKFADSLWQARRGITHAAMAFGKFWLSLRARKWVGQRGDVSVERALGRVFLNPNLPATDRAVLSWLLATVEGVQGAPADQLSLLDFDLVELRLRNAVPVGGYEQLIRDAARGVDIRLGKEVKEIAYGANGVSVGTNDGDFSADLAVVTVPLGVLKTDSLQFDPPLSEKRRATINRIGYGGRGVLNKIALRFPNRFWPAHCERLAALPRDVHRRGAFSYWIDLEMLTGIPVLVGFASGSVAADWDLHASDAEVCAQALGVLRRMFSARIPEPESYRVTHWLSDPWSLGSYSYAAVGNSKDDRRALSEPISGRVFFSGEATHEMDYGTVHGALLAGEREALRIHRYHCCNKVERVRLPWYRAT